MFDDIIFTDPQASPAVLKVTPESTDADFIVAINTNADAILEVWRKLQEHKRGRD